MLLAGKHSGLANIEDASGAPDAEKAARTPNAEEAAYTPDAQNTASALASHAARGDG